MPVCDDPLRRSLLCRGLLGVALGPLLPSLSAEAAVLSGCVCSFHCDVLVIGAGAAGLASAISAAQTGAKVLVVEKMSRVGGNSILSESAVCALEDSSVPGLSAKTVREIKEDRAELLKEMARRGKTSMTELDEALIDGSSDAVKWLLSIGCDLVRAKTRYSSKHVWEYRTSFGEPLGNELIRQLLIEAERYRIPVITNARVNVIRRTADGGMEVSAATLSSREVLFSAKAVILATGGFAGSLDAVGRLCPKCPKLFSTNSPGATGDGLALAKQVGADLTDLDSIMLHPTTHALSGTVIPRSIRENGAILINNRGQRFINELAAPEEIAEAILKQPGSCAWLIGDNHVLDGALAERLNATASLSRDYSISIFAEHLGVSVQSLSETIGFCRSTHAMTGDKARPVAASSFSSPPYFAIRVRPAIHASLGGIRINRNAQALDAAGRPVAGLYAAGEVTGGVHGRARFDNFGLTDALVFGREAGEHAAKEALKAADSSKALPLMRAEGAQQTKDLDGSTPKAGS